MNESFVEGVEYDAALPHKLNKLFDVMHKRSEAPLTNPQAAEAITAKTGVSVSVTEIVQLRNGSTNSVTVAQLQAIAEFFGIVSSYLTEPGDHPDIDVQLDIFAAMRDASINTAPRVHCSRLGAIPVARETVDAIRTVINDGEARDGDRVDAGVVTEIDERRNKSSVVPQDQPRSMVATAWRRLRASIHRR